MASRGHNGSVRDPRWLASAWLGRYRGVLLLVAALSRGLDGAAVLSADRRHRRRSPGLSADVTVDPGRAWHPPGLRRHADDLFFAQGYVQAQDRFFEMDFRRHVTAGRLAELFGEDALEDRQIRAHAGVAPGRRAGAGRC